MLGGCETMVHGVKTMLVYIRSGWYCRWMFETCLIQYFEQLFLRICGFLQTPWIKFSHLFIGFMHTHLHYIYRRLLGMKISFEFHLNLVNNRGMLWGSVVCTISILHFLSYCSNPPYLCFSFAGK